MKHSLANILSEKLTEAGVPIDGISNADGTLSGMKIQFQAEATAEQKAQAREIRADLFANRKQAEADSKLVSDRNNLSAAQLAQVLIDGGIITRAQIDQILK